MSDAVARLWERFRPLVDQRVELLRAHAEGDPGVPREEALRVAHNLAGSLGSYGRPAGSEIARRIEEALQQGVPPAALAPLVADLRTVVEG
ncbi:Hpt domain-containing protein [Geodermatophilus obscurus]|uniref:Hpt protein n=1 Tax=Geodermatophilus obscurus (strain ATCC 25078 / DSM 43160 / JCM 3152 / CCUG 61914 / KCC A-0152 / KCTC 9177 / NBRC 13315 / NRRL B-3577 / G-20) TaxID=526225 RepID=D2SC75_GEOOG|nr:Hpt domain-containing protein [Geodermatophilus obscurus]ADB74243.1 Hpt protein [Geodermatophilus obscurus DSM 43160]